MHHATGPKTNPFVQFCTVSYDLLQFRIPSLLRFTTLVFSIWVTRQFYFHINENKTMNCVTLIVIYFIIYSKRENYFILSVSNRKKSIECSILYIRCLRRIKAYLN